MSIDNFWSQSQAGTLIFPKLNHKDLCRASQVSKQWKVLAERESLWEKLCKENWYVEKPLDGSWKLKFKLSSMWNNTVCFTEQHDLRKLPQRSKHQFSLDLKVRSQDKVLGYQLDKENRSIKMDVLGIEQPLSLQLDQQFFDVIWRLADEYAQIGWNFLPTFALNSDYLAIAIRDEKKFQIQIFDRKIGNFLKNIEDTQHDHEGIFDLSFQGHLLVYDSKKVAMVWDIDQDDSKMLLGAFNLVWSEAIVFSLKATPGYIQDLDSYHIKKTYLLNRQWLLVIIDCKYRSPLQSSYSPPIDAEKAFLLKLSSGEIQPLPSTFAFDYAIDFDNRRIAEINTNGDLIIWEFDDSDIKLKNHYNKPFSTLGLGSKTGKKLIFTEGHLIITYNHKSEDDTTYVMSYHIGAQWPSQLPQCPFNIQEFLIDRERMIVFSDDGRAQIYDFSKPPIGTGNI